MLRDAQPFLFRECRIRPGLLSHELQHGIRQVIRILASRNENVQLVPQPLSGSRKVEVVPFDGEAVDERYLASGWMAGIIPVARLQHDGAQKSNFHHFATNSVDLDPVTSTNTVATHQDKPAEEGYDEIFERDGKSSSRQSQDGGQLTGSAKQHQQNDQHADELSDESKHQPHGSKTAAIGAQSHVEPLDCSFSQDQANQSQQNPQQGT